MTFVSEINMKLLHAYREAFRTSALLIAIVALYGIAGALDDDNQDSVLNRWLLNLTNSEKD